ncbi:MAG: hypothetical protein KAR16_06430 [Bacteroidales bacterium]|nr:hypothetical protein [Bacteroidales bacterium]
MKATDIDSLKSAWKNEQGFENKTLSQTDIEKFLQKKSKDITHLFKVGLTIDVVLKSIIGVSLMGIIILFSGNQQMVISMTAILGLILWAIWFQLKMYRSIPQTGMSEPAIRTSLEARIQFYHQRYVKSLYIGALSNSLFFISGSLYYFYFKYGEIRPMDIVDFLVFGTAIIIAFVIGAVAQIAQHNFHVKQLESCLQEIDEETMTALTIKEQRNKKLKLFFIALTALVCGLLLLAYFVFR